MRQGYALSAKPLSVDIGSPGQAVRKQQQDREGGAEGGGDGRREGKRKGSEKNK